VKAPKVRTIYGNGPGADQISLVAHKDDRLAGEAAGLPDLLQDLKILYSLT
jgi:hypothetical protein